MRRLYEVEADGRGRSPAVDLETAILGAKNLGAEANPRILDAGTGWNALRGDDFRRLRCGEYEVALNRNYDIPGVYYEVHSGYRFLGSLVKDGDRNWRYRTAHDRRPFEMPGFAYPHTAAAALLKQYPESCLRKWL